MNLEELTFGMPGLSPRAGATLAEAGGLCLQRNNHNIGVALEVVGDYSGSYPLFWKQIEGDQIENSYDDDDATELGACGIAITVLSNLANYKVIKRSYKNTGFDYWLGEGNSDLLFQNKTRLEVSGIMHNDDMEIKRRTKKKITQTDKSDYLGIPAIIAITEFSKPVCNLVKK